MELVIKRFDELTAKELYEILRLRAEVFVVEQECVYQDCDDRDQNAWHLYAEENGIMQGCLRILEKGQTFDVVAIGRLAVKAECRGAGLARRMMEEALAFLCGRCGERIVKISAQVYVADFYKSLGFHPISDTYVEDGIPHMDMEYRDTDMK